MQLTSSQRKAIEYNVGPLLVIAGAGTGKTTVLVEKVKFLIREKLATPEEILLLTYTDKAAREMEERIDVAIPYGYFQMQISTFHSFCDKILSDEASHIGLSPGYKLQTQAQSILFIKKNIFSFDLNYFRPLGNPDKFIHGLVQHFSRLADENIEPAQYLQWAKNNHQKLRRGDEKEFTEAKKFLELAKAYEKYQLLKVKENIFDFSDLITYTLKLLQKRKNILYQYQKKYPYILIDEFQDTNIAQYEFMKLLSRPISKPHLTVVGDDSQAIYKFRGASVSNILQFMQDYKESEKVVLIDNFRSSQSILDMAYRSIKNNDPDTLEARLDISKNLKSMVGQGTKDDVQFYLAERVEEEADFVATEISKLVQKNSINFKDIAILVRANKHSEPFLRALSRMGIPFQFLGPGTLFKQPEVKDLIAYLKVLYDISDSSSLYRLISMGIFGIEPFDIARITSLTRQTGISLFEALNVYLAQHYEDFASKEYEVLKKYLVPLSKTTIEKLYTIVIIVRKALSKLKSHTAGQILYDFLESSSYLDLLTKSKTAHEERVVQNISKFFDKLKNFESEHDDASVFATVEYINMSMDFGESPLAAETDWTENNAVNILTIHSAKGLEFPVVFLANLINGRFPTISRREQIPLPEELIKEILPLGDFHIQEERRLFYVAVTRAMKKLYLTAANYYGEAKKERKVSPFVGEAVGEEIIIRQKEKKIEKKKQLSIFDFKTREEPIQKEENNIRTLSYSQLNTFQTCPLRYKYQYVLKIPTKPSAAASFGQTIHLTLQKFYALHREGKKPNLQILLTFLEKNWIPMGYTSPFFEKKMKENGAKMLKDFYKNFYEKKTSIVDLEKWFKTKIDDKISVIGKIDRIDKIGHKLEIIDYKTGKPPAGKKLQSSLQMSIYALAASDPGLYRERLSNIILTFYFLQNSQKVSSTLQQDQIEETKKEILQIAKKINQLHFEPRVGPWCDFCSFRINCEAWQ